jgi:pimeloyl-ACP methyl ester carboxylesterase
MTIDDVALPDGGRLAVSVRGATLPDPPILLIRPLGGSIALWGEFADRLAERRRVLVFDHRGVGFSQPGDARTTTQQLARDALHVLDHLSISIADVFGISLGGMTATWLARIAPQRIARLCLAATPAEGVALSRAGVRRGLALAACFARAGDDVEPALVRRVLSRRFRAEHPDRLAQIERTVRATPTPRAALLRLALAGARHDASRELCKIAATTLVLTGERDALLGPEPTRALAAAIPGATHDVIPDAGHDLTLEQPLATAERVANFFA